MLWKGTFPAVVSGIGHGIILRSNEHKVQGLLCYSILISIQYYCSHVEEKEKNSNKLMFSHLFLCCFAVCITSTYLLSLYIHYFFFNSMGIYINKLAFPSAHYLLLLADTWTAVFWILVFMLPLYSYVDGIVMSLWINILTSILSLSSTF